MVVFLKCSILNDDDSLSERFHLQICLRILMSDIISRIILSKSEDEYRFYVLYTLFRSCFRCGSHSRIPRQVRNHFKECLPYGDSHNVFTSTQRWIRDGVTNCPFEPAWYVRSLCSPVVVAHLSFSGKLWRITFTDDFKKDLRLAYL